MAIGRLGRAAVGAVGQLQELHRDNAVVEASVAPVDESDAVAADFAVTTTGAAVTTATAKVDGVIGGR